MEWQPLDLPHESLRLMGEVFVFLLTLTFVIAAITLKKRTRHLFPLSFLSIFALSSLGWVIGYNMSNSREPAVAAVLPAVLTLVAGMLAYILGSRGALSRLLVCLATIGFSLSLYVASFAGARHRFNYEERITKIDYLKYQEGVRQEIAATKLFFEANFRQLRAALGKKYGVNLDDVASAEPSRQPASKD
jgi:hypothetical protein